MVLALNHSLQHELASKGICIQAVLPVVTVTELWDIAGLPYRNLPAETVMSAEDMVDAAPEVTSASRLSIDIAEGEYS